MKNNIDDINGYCRIRMCIGKQWKKPKDEGYVTLSRGEYPKILASKRVIPDGDIGSQRAAAVQTWA